MTAEPEERALLTDKPEARALLGKVRRRLADVEATMDRSPEGARKALAEISETIQHLDDALADADAPGQTPSVISIDHPILGVAPAPIGWVGVICDPQAPRPRVVAGERLSQLIEAARESLRLDLVCIVARDEVTSQQAPAEHGDGNPSEVHGEVAEWLATQPTVPTQTLTSAQVWSDMAAIAHTAAAENSATARLGLVDSLGLPAPSLLNGMGFAAINVVDAYAAALCATH